MRPIEEVKPGDKVLSNNVKTGEVGYKKVLSVSQRIAPVILAITLLSGAALEVTPEHPFRLADGAGGWVPAGQLTGRHVLVEKSGYLPSVDGFKIPD